MAAQSGVSLHKGFKTDSSSGSRLCSGIASGRLFNQVVVCAAIDDQVVVYTVKKLKDADELSFSAVAEFRADFSAAESTVNCITIIEEFSLIVTGGQDGECRTWKILPRSHGSWAAKLSKQLHKHGGPVMCVQRHPINARWVVCASRDGSAAVCDVIRAGDSEVAVIPVTVNASVVAAAAGGKVECRGCCFSADGRSLFLLHCPRKGKSFVAQVALRMSTGTKPKAKKLDVNLDYELVVSAAVSSVPCTRLCRSDSGRYIAVGCSDGAVVMMDADAHLAVVSRSRVLHDLPVTGMSFLPSPTDDVEVILSCSADNKLIVHSVGSKMQQLLIVLLIILLLLAAGLLIAYVTDSHKKI